MENIHKKGIINAIETLGLEPKQAKIYLAALEGGSATVAEIAHIAQIERTGIYYHIDELIRTGLLRVTQKGQRKLYMATDPSKLKAILDSKQAQLKKALPYLQAQYAQKSNKSIIQYFEGLEELENFYDNMQNNLYHLEEFNNTIHILGHNYSKVREHYESDLGSRAAKQQLPIVTKVIMPRSEKPRGKDKMAQSFMTVRFNLPPAEYKFIEDKYSNQGSVGIIGNKIYSVDFQNRFASITENKNLASTWRNFFECLWEKL